MKEEILESHLFPVTSSIFAKSVAGHIGSRRALLTLPVKKEF